MNRLRPFVVGAVSVGLVLATSTKLGGIDPAWALKLFVVWIAGLFTLGGMRALTEVARPEPSVMEAWVKRTRPRPRQPQRLSELERLIEFSGLSAFDLNYRLRVVLRQIAVERLGRRGLTMEDDAARQILGEAVWRFLAPAKGSPMPTEGSGWRHREIGEIVDALEKL